MAHKDEKIIAEFPFHASKPKWAGSIQVVERDQFFDDGNRRIFSDFRIQARGRYILLSALDTEEICDAIIAGAQAAKEHFRQLRERDGSPPRNGNSRNGRREDG